METRGATRFNVLGAGTIELDGGVFLVSTAREIRAADAHD